MPRILIGDKLDAQGIQILRDAGLEFEERLGLEGDALKEALRAFDGIIIRSKPILTAEALEDPGNLKAIVRAGVGINNIDLPMATRHGIVVMNTPDANTYSTAEHTVTMLTSLSRLIPQADRSLHEGKWERSSFVGAQLRGKTLGIIGLGRIGCEVAKRAQGFEMKVAGCEPMMTAERAARLGVDLKSNVDELLPECDYLTVHVPLNSETRNLINKERLAKLKPGARVINCARGGIVNEEALVEALQSGHLAGAALDVFVEEPPPADHPLLQLPNVVVTPHLGASTVEAQISVATEAAQLMTDFLLKGVIRHAVNVSAIDRAELEELRLYVDLARRLGLLQAQMASGAIQRVELTYRGEIAGRNTKLLTSSFTAGLLEPHLAQQVNVVNAPILAEERGIEIVTQSSETRGDFGTLFQSVVQTDKQSWTASGTLFGNQFLRLVRLGPYHMDTYLDGILLLFSHRDVPGLIGYIGSLFGKHQVNISRMTVGRQVQGGEAIAVLNLDNLPSEEAINEVLEHPQISSVSVVKLPAVGEMPPWFG